MKVIVSVQAKRASSRGLIHYIAHSKLDAARESAGREIFNGQANEITVEKANSLLNNETARRRPSNEELHHLVISLKSEDFERLGADEKERVLSVKEITRHTMKRLENELGAQRLDWAAGVHLNTDNPHVHIAINKSYFDKNLEKKHLSKIYLQLLPHYEKNEEGEKIFVRGSLIESATEKLEEICREKETKRIAEKQKSQADLSQNQTSKKSPRSNEGRKSTEENTNVKSKMEVGKERDHLARAVLAKYYLEKSKENLDSLVNHGDKRRFRILDEISGKTRSISLFDLERRAEKCAARKLKTQNITDAVKKEELRKTLVEDEMQKNLGGIKRIKTILHNLVKKESGELKKREEDYKTVKPIAEKIRENYRQENKKLPAPNLITEELEMLQAEALEKKNFRTANYFERVRLELSVERGVPTRTKEELQHLKAKQTLSELRVLFQEKQLKTIGARKRHFPVEFDGKKRTLSSIDELIEKQTLDDQKLTGKISKVLSKIGLIERKNELKQLEEIKSQIIEKLNEKQEHFSQEITREKSRLKTLNSFYDKDKNHEKETVLAKFNAKELEQIESLAGSLKLPEIYRENWLQQKQFIEGSGNDHQATSDTKRKVIAGRALVRQVMSEIELARCKEELKIFKKHKDFTKFAVTNKKTGEEKFVSLSEVRFDSRGSLFDQTLEYFLENREKRETRRNLEKLVKEKQVELKSNLRDAKAISKTASEEARDFQTRSIFGSVKFLHEPLFTPKELMTIELRVNQTLVKSEAKNLQKILDAADHSKAKNLSAILSSSMPKAERFKQAETIFEASQNKENLTEKNEETSALKGSENRENKTKILIQDRGR
jgi:hypothetical protein